MESEGLEFWHFLLNGTLDEETGAFVNYYAYGEHFGIALDKAIHSATAEEIINPVLIEANQLDTLDDFELPEDAFEVSKNVYMLPSINTYDLKDDELFFVCPTGVIGNNENDSDEFEKITENFVAFNANEAGIFELELVVGRDKLVDTFFKAITFLPSVDSLFFYIWNHWDDKQTELWISDTLTNQKSILNFLSKNKASTLENGFLDCVVYSNVGETNLTLDDHKKIQLHTKNETVFKDFIGNIIDLGFEQTRDFYNIEFDYYHWHYRPGNSLSRDDFKVLLELEDFKLIDQWDEPNEI